METFTPDLTVLEYIKLVSPAFIIAFVMMVICGLVIYLFDLFKK